MPLTDQQRNALPAVRAYISQAMVPSATAESVDERARHPDPAHVPADVTVRVEIAPPSTRPHPLLERSGLRTPERVPLYFYALQNDQSERDVVNTHVIFFMHGGANITGHPTHEPFIHLFSQLLRAVALRAGGTHKCVLVAPSYRLATVPANAFPAALQDLVAAYDHVLCKGYRASNIIVAGDSAGGNYGQPVPAPVDTPTNLTAALPALVLTHLVLKSDRPPPQGVIVIAPAAIWAPGWRSEYAKAQASADVIDVSNTGMLASLYVGDSGVPLTDPLVSGAFIPFDASWPKTLILIGSADQLIDASRELEKRLAEVKRPVELVEYDQRPHAWWALLHIFPEDIQDAAQRIARFVLY